MEKPYVIINIAMTVDGKIDTFERQGASISSSTDWVRVDRLRADCDAVMVGGRALLEEDPRLTVKSPELHQERLIRGKTKNPVKIGVISDTHIPINCESISQAIKDVFKNVDMILHAGDLVDYNVVEMLKEITPNVIAVCGNMDSIEVCNKFGIPSKKLIKNY